VADGVVTRPAGEWSPTVHAFLRYLRAQGLTCVPEPIAVEADVERLVAIEGDAGAAGWNHQHSDAGLRSAVQLLRTVHDASVGWIPPPDAVFRVPEVACDGDAVWCHGDIGPWNMVWRDGEAVGLIDWDFLHRGPRLDDVAYGLRWFAPARDDENALEWHHFPTVPDRAHRVRVFLDAYGELEPFDVAEAIAARIEVTMAHELALAEAGVEPQRTWVADGSQEWAADEAQWVREHARLLAP
jgi:aminoglycoside phosphotransferase (APT) family kinase protein